MGALVQPHTFRCEAAVWQEGPLHPWGAPGTLWAPRGPLLLRTDTHLLPAAPPSGLGCMVAERPLGLCRFTPWGKGSLFIYVFTYTFSWGIPNTQK